MSLQVVNLGLPKSGTSTLARALRRACLSCADHKIIPRGEKVSKTETYVGKLIYRGFFETGDPGAYLDGFDSISEMSALGHDLSLWPQTDFAIIEAFRDRHPGLRFVATRRDTFRMSQSMLAWTNMKNRLQQADIPGLPTGYGDTSKARMQWIDGHYGHLRSLFAGDDAFLELDVAAPDARDKLAGHLGRALPWWGKRNANPLISDTGLP